MHGVCRRGVGVESGGLDGGRSGYLWSTTNGPWQVACLRLQHRLVQGLVNIADSRVGWRIDHSWLLRHVVLRRRLRHIRRGLLWDYYAGAVQGDLSKRLHRCYLVTSFLCQGVLKS